MSDKLEATAFFGLFLLGLIIGGLGFGRLCYLSAESKYQSKAIEHGYAEYNGTTGQWQWKEAVE